MKLTDTQVNELISAKKRSLNKDISLQKTRGSIGDLLLLFETAVFEGNPFFLLGMASFALAHVCFIYAMIGGVPVSNINAKRHWGQLATATLLLVFGVEFFILNRESFGELKMAILTYCVALVVMSIAASLRMLHHGTESRTFESVTTKLAFAPSDARKVTIVLPLTEIADSPMVSP